MKRLLLPLLSVLALLGAQPVAAQSTVSAKVVSACGTPGNTPVAGNSYPITQDTTGVLCTSAGGGGGGAVTIANGADVTQGAIADTAYTGTAATSQAYLRAIADAAIATGAADVNQTQVNGVAVSTGSGVLGTGTQRVVLATDQPAVAVTVASVPLPTGAATSALQDDAYAPITPATATAISSILLGAEYRSTLPTWTNTQQGALQVGTRGSLNTTLFGADSAQSIVGLSDNANGVASNSGARNLGVMARETIFNGTSWDRVEKASVVGRLPTSAATTNATSLEASSGTILNITAMNTTAAVIYLKLYNKATAPTVGTDVPVLTLPLPVSNALAVVNFTTGLYFTTGIAYALTTGAADADTGAVGAGAAVGLNIAYVP